MLPSRSFVRTICLLLLVFVAASANIGSHSNIFLRDRTSNAKAARKHPEAAEQLDNEEQLSSAPPPPSTIEGSMTTKEEYPITTSVQRHRYLEGYEDYFTDLDVESLEEGFALGAVFLSLIIVICLLCCCCQMCCGGGRGGGGGNCFMDMLALFCCYEIFCDDTPGCFLPMADGDLC